MLCTNGAFKVLALGIVPAQVLADQIKPFSGRASCGVLALACWSTPYVTLSEQIGGLSDVQVKRQILRTCNN
jgi:hypothetical protein